jgi:putative nucleotidyltransferase with HDIG domain
MPTREDAWKLLNDYVSSPALVRHCLAVEAAMRAYAAKYAEDVELWGMSGLLHDFDYEKFPTYDAVAQTGHPYEGVKILREKGYPSEMLQAILGHAQYSGVPRDTRMAKCLFASDELAGFIVAVGKVRPDGLATVTPEAVKKQLGKKKFAEKVSREDIAQGVKELGVPEDEHIRTLIEALQKIAPELGFMSSSSV